MNFLGIEFSTFRRIVERGKQTAAVLYFCINFIILLPTVLILCMFLLFSRFYFIPLLYFLWLVYDHNACVQGGRRWEDYRQWKLWHYFRDYFPIKMIKSSELDPAKNYIMGYHPHGIMTVGNICCFGTEATNFSREFPGIVPRILTLRNLFCIPLLRETILSQGLCAVSKESIEWHLTKEGTGNALVIVVGGASESLESEPGCLSLILKKRKGFIKLALQHGASLVPVIGFGENDLFLQVKFKEGSFVRRIQNKIKAIFGLTIPLFYGRGIILPFRRPVTVIIGKPIDVEKISEPTEEDINRVHQIYMDKLTELFEEHKSKYGHETQLKIM